MPKVDKFIICHQNENSLCDCFGQNSQMPQELTPSHFISIFHFTFRLTSSNQIVKSDNSQFNGIH